MVIFFASSFFEVLVHNQIKYYLIILIKLYKLNFGIYLIKLIVKAKSVVRANFVNTLKIDSFHIQGPSPDRNFLY